MVPLHERVTDTQVKTLYNAILEGIRTNGKGRENIAYKVSKSSTCSAQAKLSRYADAFRMRAQLKTYHEIGQALKITRQAAESMLHTVYAGLGYHDNGKEGCMNKCESVRRIMMTPMPIIIARSEAENGIMMALEKTNSKRGKGQRLRLVTGHRGKGVFAAYAKPRAIKGIEDTLHLLNTKVGSNSDGFRHHKELGISKRSLEALVNSYGKSKPFFSIGGYVFLKSNWLQHHVLKILESRSQLQVTGLADLFAKILVQGDLSDRERNLVAVASDNMFMREFCAKLAEHSGSCALWKDNFRYWVKLTAGEGYITHISDIEKWIMQFFRERDDQDCRVPILVQAGKQAGFKEAAIRMSVMRSVLFTQRRNILSVAAGKED